MEIYLFKKRFGKKLVNFSQISIMSRLINTLNPAHEGCMYLFRVEWHETKSNTGLTANVIESEEMALASFMSLTTR